MDRSVLMENLLSIDNKERAVVPFKLNPVQRKFNDEKRTRNFIIKARQHGISTYILADMFTEAISIPNTSCVVVSHEGHATQRLLAKIHFFYDTMPEPKPVIDHHSASEITFPLLHSSIYIGTSGSRAFGHGDKIDHAHLSEFAYYEDAERIINGVEEAVPLTGELDIETTPNGEGNAAFEMWGKAREGKSGYKPFFFPWWMCADYTIPKGSELALPADQGDFDYTQEELKLVKSFDVTKDQLRWRRRKLADKGALFYQEYPEDEVNCFLQSGEPVFDPALLGDMALSCSEGKRMPGNFFMWREPIKNGLYVIGADCAAGVEKGSFSAASVLDENFNVCATFQARLDPSQFATVLADMGKFYNNAQLAVERNAQGYAVLAKLIDYPNLYMQRDYATGRQTEKLGWWTSEQTKNYLISTFRNTLAKMHIWDANLVRQARSYTYIKFKPTTQGFDDLLMATMIAVGIRQMQGSSRGFIGQAQRWSW